MSGRKRALMRLKEKDRLLINKIGGRLKEVNRDFKSLEKKIDHFQEHRKSRNEQSLQERHSSLCGVLDQLSNQTIQFENQNSNLLTIQKEILDTEFYELRHSLNKDNKNIQRNIEHSIASKIEDYFSFNRERLTSIENKLDELGNEETERKDYVYGCYFLARELIDKVIDLYRPSQHYLDSIKDMDIELEISLQNIQNNFYEAALVGIQRSLVELNKIQFALEDDIKQGDQLVQEALNRTVDLLDYAKSCKAIPAININGDELPVTIDVNYWSSGRLPWIILQLEELLSWLANISEMPNIQYLINLIDDVLPDWKSEIQSSVVRARKEVLESQMRYDVALLAIEALREQGYGLKIGNYQVDDMRNPYQIVLNRIDGSQVEIRISHDLGEFEQYSIDIQSQDMNYLTEHEMKFRALELLSSLKNAGFNIESIIQEETQFTRVSEPKDLNQYYINRIDKKL